MLTLASGHLVRACNPKIILKHTIFTHHRYKSFFIFITKSNSAGGEIRFPYFL